MLEITEYWNKVIDDPSNAFGTRVLRGEYEKHKSFKVEGTLADLKRRWKNNPKMEFAADHIREDCGRHYGIHAYRMIRPA